MRGIKVKNTNILIIGAVLICLIIIPYNIQAQEYLEEIKPDLSIWPAQEYILEISNAMMAEGGTHTQYYGQHKLKLETSMGEISNAVIYHFNEDNIKEIIILPDEKMYMESILSYEEFFETNDAGSGLLYDNLPGEEMAMYGADKIGEETFLNREVERWSFVDTSEGETVNIEMLIDRELRQFMKMWVDGELIFEVTNLTIGKIPDETFNPPEDFEVMSY